MNKTTAENLTDEQIREYRSELHEGGHTDTVYIADCDDALAGFAGYRACQASRARARIAAAINARREAENQKTALAVFVEPGTVVS